MQTRDTTLIHHGGKSLIALSCALALSGCMAWSDQGQRTNFLSNWTQTASAQPALNVSQAIVISAPAATFIVRFNDEPELDKVCRNFRRDEAGTRAAFNAWAAKHAPLKGLQLVRASYSGELILALPASAASGRSARDVIAALETIDNLAYAEIDSMASASDGG